MGIALITDQQKKVFGDYASESKDTETESLNNKYSGFLKVLHDIYPETNRALILLNRFLNPAYFRASTFNKDTFIEFNTVLALYIETTDDIVRASHHRKVVGYLKNTDLFLTLPRTKVISAPYTDEIVPKTYVKAADDLSEIGSLGITETMATLFDAPLDREAE